MKQITAEEGLALIEKYQHKNLKGLDPNDATSTYKMLMKNHRHFYLFESSTQEPSYYGANRTHLLLDEIIPEIEQLGKLPIYYHFILLASPDAMFMIPQTRRTAKEAIHRKGAVESHKGYWFYCRPSEDNQRFH